MSNHIRKKDNFDNTKNYILNQLFIYDYSDSNNVEILQKKLFVLDGPLTEKEKKDGTPDTDVENPMDHWHTLQNDLVYLDKYIRTHEGKLEEEERPFDKFWDERIKQKEVWINTIKDKESGEKYKDYEQPYMNRPTLLSKDDFSELYNEFKQRDDLDSAFDITKKITSECIDQQIVKQEHQVENHVPANEVEDNLKVEAEKKKKEDDDLYVSEMRGIHAELDNIVKYCLEEIIIEAIEDNQEEEENGEEENGNGFDIGEGHILVLYKPQIRKYVEVVENHGSHKGPVIEQTGEGGYRFNVYEYKDDDFSIFASSSGDSDWVNYVGDLENSWMEATITYYVPDEED